ncbi:MAG: oligosaccharide flippase family protein [Betaproteobacteria bacterium]|nr:oligosaccharide flippase family protein [Betaproteobacteria bacterium]
MPTISSIVPIPKKGRTLPVNLVSAASRIYRRFAHVRKEAGWVVAGQVLAFAGSLAAVKVLTNVMPPESYGELALGLSIAGLITMFLFGPLGQVVLRFYSVCLDRGHLAPYFQVLQRLHLQALALLMIACVPVAAATYAMSGASWAWLAGAAILFGVVSGLQGSLQSLFSAMRERKACALFQAADVWLRLAFALLIIRWAGTRGYWAMAGYLLGAVAVVALQIAAVRGRHSPNAGKSGEKPGRIKELEAEFLAYGLPFVSFAGLAAISQYADRWLLQAFWSEQQVGIYAALYQVASAPLILTMGVVSQLIIPVVFARAGGLTEKARLSSGRRLLSHTLVALGLAFLAITLFAYVWGEWLVAWFTNPAFAAHGDVLWIIVLALSFFNLAQLMVASGLSLNRSRIYFWPKLGQAAGLLIAGYFLVQEWAIPGMASALLLSSLLYFAWVGGVNVKLGRSLASVDSRLG